MTLLTARRQAAYFQLLNSFHWIGTLDDVRLRAVVEMVYILGIGDFRQFTKLIAAIWAQDWRRAEAETLDSAWHQQDPHRCELIAGMLLTGEDAPIHG